MESIYKLAKMVVEKKYPNNKEIHPIFICSLYALLCKYKNHANLVCDLFLNTDIFMEKDTINNILIRHELEGDMENEEDPLNRTYAISNQGHTFTYVPESQKIVYDLFNPFIICSLLNTNINHLINSFIHEMNHLIKGEINGHKQFNDNNDITDCIIRTGVAHYVFKYDLYNDTLVELEYFNALDEAINTIQTTEITKNVLSLYEFVKDPEIIDFLNTLDKDKLSKDYGYEDVVCVVRELWNNDELRELFENNMINGDIDVIANKFNTVTGNDSAFIKMSEILDKIADYDLDINNKKKYNKEVKKFKKMIKTYSDNSEQMRNNS